MQLPKLIAAMVVLSIMGLAWIGLSSLAAQAQQGPAEPLPRFQISAWAYPAYAGEGYRSDAKRGAYIIDSQSGRVWVVEGRQSPEVIGQVQ